LFHLIRWKQLKEGISSLIAVFCWQVMLKNLEQVVSMILNGFQNPHPRVRWAAINAIGQLSTDLGPDLQVHYHQKALPSLANAMDDFQNPRVQVSSSYHLFEICCYYSFLN
jgi:importin-5